MSAFSSSILRLCSLVIPAVAALVQVTSAAGQDLRPGRSAERHGVGIGVADTAAREGVDVGCLVIVGPVAADLGGAVVVG